MGIEKFAKPKFYSITKDFGIKTLRIFGSVSRNEQTEQSDLDICVETETPNPFYWPT